MRPNLQELLARLEATDREGDKLQHVLIGTPDGIHEAQHSLHVMRYAEALSWSPLVPMPGTNWSMSVLTRYRRSNID